MLHPAKLLSLCYSLFAFVHRYDRAVLAGLFQADGEISGRSNKKRKKITEKNEFTIEYYRITVYYVT